MKNTIIILSLLLSVCSCNENNTQTKNDFIIGSGQIPQLAKDKNNLYAVYGNGDSIMYSQSSDNGETFSKPSLISVVPNVYAFAMRGPQIAVANKNIIVTACTTSGNIFSFYKTKNDAWTQGSSVNDADTVCKEGLMALSADGNNAFAVWLDLRGNKRNKIYGAKSADGGKTWSKNIFIYASPDSSVCECCKPSVIMNGKNIFVMFRNWLNGNRDLYLVQSTDGGNTFSHAQKLGVGNWPLNGCPMDGGAIALNNGTPETVWRRENKIFTATPGMPEKEIGQGHNCTIETVNGKNVYAWIENDDVVFVNAQGEKKFLGKGSLPVLKTVNNKQVICVWQNEKQIHASILAL